MNINTAVGMELLYPYVMLPQKSYYFFPVGENWKFVKKNAALEPIME
jgi:hypothetical protein